jgi:GR25 family glycosyltransferase involved in LPS biosynthesis
MKGYVITIMDMSESVKSAERCIKSAGRYGFEVEIFPATTPEDNPSEYLLERGISVKDFKEVYSRFDNCVAAFTSHYRLWEKCFSEKTSLVVLEHDAYFVDAIPNIPVQGVLSYGAPSYGKFRTPPSLGVNRLQSKEYLPGAHAYGVSPDAAEIMIRRAVSLACPTDLYICNKNFPFVNEYYPWPVEARDSFTSIQTETGCLAKHSYQKDASKYKII